MIGSLLSVIQRSWDTPQCKFCNKKLYTVLHYLLHFKKEIVNFKPTKKDLRFILKYNIFARFVKIVFCSLVLGIIILLKIILAPFYFLFEIL